MKTNPNWPYGLNYISGPPNKDYWTKKDRGLVILGSTGSIGKNAIEVARLAGLKISGLACGRNIQLLAEQAGYFKPSYLAVLDEDLATRLKSFLPADYHPHILFGQSGYATLAALPDISCVLSAQAGSSGLAGTLAAAFAGKVIALANKESLVIAGDLLRMICMTSGASILPIDSEHYALFECAAGRSNIKSLILTASGGPFLGKSAAEIATATPAEALRHPNWKMGAKISVDSATMMNKGLELIEAVRLFGISPNSIKILVHPQSIIHSLCEFEDNSMLGQFATADMKLAIGACLMWPDASHCFIECLDLARISKLTFFEPDYETFPCLKLAIDALTYTPSIAWQELGLNPACIVLNAANESAVELFLAGKCAFGEISDRIARTLMSFRSHPQEAPAVPQAGLSPDKRALAYVELIGKLEQKARKTA